MGLSFFWVKYDGNKKDEGLGIASIGSVATLPKFSGDIPCPQQHLLQGGSMPKKRFRDKEIKFFVTEAELQFIDQKAQVAELNRSSYIRKMALEGYILKQDFSYVEKLVYEVNKIGNNINQIAYKANSMEYLSTEDLKYLQKRLDEIYSRISLFYGSG